MRRLLPVWLTGPAVSVSLVLGCQHNQPCCCIPCCYAPGQQTAPVPASLAGPGQMSTLTGAPTTGATTPPQPLPLLAPGQQRAPMPALPVDGDTLSAAPTASPNLAGLQPPSSADVGPASAGAFSVPTGEPAASLQGSTSAPAIQTMPTGQASDAAAGAAAPAVPAETPERASAALQPPPDAGGWRAEGSAPAAPRPMPSRQEGPGDTIPQPAAGHTLPDKKESLRRLDAPSAPPATLPPVPEKGSGEASEPPLAAPLTPATPPTSSQRLGHDLSYRWLVGQLDYVAIQRGWVVRYAGLDEEDRYGGCVSLVVSGLMNGCRSGQRVRVTGEVLDPESDRPRPMYRVQTLQVLSEP